MGKGNSVPLSELATIRYEKGPQVIKSEDTFLIGYVLFDKLSGFAEVAVVEKAQDAIQQKINSGELIVPKGILSEVVGNGIVRDGEMESVVTNVTRLVKFVHKVRQGFLDLWF